MLHWFFLSSSFFLGGDLVRFCRRKNILNKHTLTVIQSLNKTPLVQNLELFLSGFVDDFTVLQELNITKCGFPVDGPLKVTIWMFHFASSFKDSLTMFQFDSSPLTRHSRTHPIWCFSGVWLGSEWIIYIYEDKYSVSICYQTWQE